MRRLTSVVALALVVVLAGCSQFTVRTGQDPAEDFAALKTFSWLPTDLAAPADQRTQDRLVSKRIREDVEKALVAKGWTPAAADQPADLFMNWRISTNPATSWNVDPDHTVWGTGWWTGWAGGGQVYSDSYDSGTLFIAAMDAQGKKVVWLGAAEARLLPHISLERRLDRVDDAVAQILKDFPAR